MRTTPYRTIFLLVALGSLAACEQPSSGPSSSPGAPAAEASAAGAEASPPSSIVDIPVNPGGNEPLPLIAGQSLSGSFTAPKDGNVTHFNIEIGNNLNTSDGQLTLKLCQAGVCETGSATLAGSTDNQYFRIALAKPLAIKTASPIEFTVAKDGGSVPVSIWTYSVAAGSIGMTDQAGAVVNRNPRIGIEYAE